MNNAFLEYIDAGAEPCPDRTYGEGYRCSAYLKDGTYLPCVMLRRSAPVAALAMRRFEEVRNDKDCLWSANSYEGIVKTFVAKGNRVNSHDIDRLEPSRFAIPLSLLRQIERETTVGWTGFVLEMRDGGLLPFGTTFLAEFFNMPEAYSFEDVVAVHNHSYVSTSGELRPLSEDMTTLPPDYDASRVNHERPYFTCYFDA